MSPLNLLLLLLLLLLSSASADTAFIEKTCKTTKHFDLCVSSLESDPASQSSDAQGLATIMIAVGVENSTATSSFLASRLPANPGKAALENSTKNAEKKAIKECADEYSYAADALRAAAQDLSTGPDGLDYAYVHVSAAAEYPNSCHNAFRRYCPSLPYPIEIARREDGLKRICDVVLGIIDNIGGD